MPRIPGGKFGLERVVHHLGRVQVFLQNMNQQNAPAGIGRQLLEFNFGVKIVRQAIHTQVSAMFQLGRKPVADAKFLVKNNILVDLQSLVIAPESKSDVAIQRRLEAIQRRGVGAL